MVGVPFGGIGRDRYKALHARLRKVRGVPGPCVFCSRPGQWANVMGEYEDLSDYIPLCVACHTRFDGAKLDHCARGHVRTPGNLQWHASTQKWRCGECRKVTRRTPSGRPLPY